MNWQLPPSSSWRHEKLYVYPSLLKEKWEEKKNWIVQFFNDFEFMGDLQTNVFGLLYKCLTNIDSWY